MQQITTSLFSKSNNNLSAITTLMAVLMLSVALTIIIIHQQHEALAQTDSNIFKRLKNLIMEFRFQYPSNWRVDEGDV